MSTTWCDHFEPLFSDAEDHYIGFQEVASAKLTPETITNALGYTPADAVIVGAALAEKADADTVNAALAEKADADTVNAALAEKADADTVNAALAKKADADTVNAALAEKADADTVNAALATKADKTELAETNRSLDALWKVGEGQLYELEDVEETGANNPPTGAEFMSLRELRGKAEQVTTNGYQLLSTPDATGTRDNVKFSYSNGVLKINGTSNGGSTHYVYVRGDGNITSSASGAYHIPLAQGDYKLSVKGANSDIMLTIRSETYTSPSIQGDGTIDVSIPSDMSASLNIAYAADVAFSQEIFVMLERGSVAHDWEPYTGGMPMPNPEYPSEIHGVEEINIKRTGKNLLNLQSLTLYNGSTISGQKLIPINGVIQPNETLAGYDVTDALKRMGHFTASFICSDADITARINVSIGGETKQRIPMPSTYYYTDGASYKLYVMTRPTADSKIYTEPIMLQIEAGTQVTSYEPYREEVRTITPPQTLYKIGEHADKADIVRGLWVKQILEAPVAETSWRVGAQDDTNVAFATPANRVYVDYLTEGNQAAGVKSDYFTYAGRSSGYAAALQQGRGLFSNTTATGYKFFYLVVPKTIATTAADFTQFIRANNVKIIYIAANTENAPIAADDLAYLRSLALMPVTDHIFITDQDGNDAPWLAKYIINLRRLAP